MAYEFLGPAEYMGSEPCFHSGKAGFVQGCGQLALAGGPVPTERPPRCLGSHALTGAAAQPRRLH